MYFKMFLCIILLVCRVSHVFQFGENTYKVRKKKEERTLQEDLKVSGYESNKLIFLQPSCS